MSCSHLLGLLEGWVLSPCPGAQAPAGSSSYNPLGVLPKCIQLECQGSPGTSFGPAYSAPHRTGDQSPSVSMVTHSFIHSFSYSMSAPHFNCPCDFWGSMWNHGQPCLHGPLCGRDGNPWATIPTEVRAKLREAPRDRGARGQGGLSGGGGTSVETRRPFGKTTPH